MATVQFWFDFASTYSYLSAMRIRSVADACGVAVAWRPFLLGPIFGAQGWTTSPFRIYPAKGRNMWRDMERRAAKYGVAFRRPDLEDEAAFPRNSVLAARAGLIALEAPWGEAFCREVFTAQFARGADISDAATLNQISVASGGPDRLTERAVAADNKDRLRKNVDEASRLGIYGAPSFTTGEELFWGDDRLEDALEWAAGHAG
ncbi:MAG: 2-hydroxychromene-2-carboxylate isomerase [Pseudomonadota bacterium]